MALVLEARVLPLVAFGVWSGITWVASARFAALTPTALESWNPTSANNGRPVKSTSYSSTTGSGASESQNFFASSSVASRNSKEPSFTSKRTVLPIRSFTRGSNDTTAVASSSGVMTRSLP